jgi:hypothetical protein
MRENGCPLSTNEHGCSEGLFHHWQHVFLHQVEVQTSCHMPLESSCLLDFVLYEYPW